MIFFTARDGLRDNEGRDLLAFFIRLHSVSGSAELRDLALPEAPTIDYRGEPCETPSGLAANTLPLPLATKSSEKDG